MSEFRFKQVDLKLQFISDLNPGEFADMHGMKEFYILACPNDLLHPWATVRVAWDPYCKEFMYIHSGATSREWSKDTPWALLPSFTWD